MKRINNSFSIILKKNHSQLYNSIFNLKTEKYVRINNKVILLIKCFE